MSIHMDQESLRRRVNFLTSKLDRKTDECNAKQKKIDKLLDEITILQLDVERLSNIVAPKDMSREKTLENEVAKLRRRHAELEADNINLKTENTELHEGNRSLRACQERTTIDCKKIHHHLLQSHALIKGLTGGNPSTALRGPVPFDQGSFNPLSRADSPGEVLLQYRPSENDRTATPGKSTEALFGSQTWEGAPSGDSRILPKIPHQEELRGVKEQQASDIPPPEKSPQSHQVPIAGDDEYIPSYEGPNVLDFGICYSSARGARRTAPTRAASAKSFATAFGGSSNTKANSEGPSSFTTSRSNAPSKMKADAVSRTAANQTPTLLEPRVPNSETGPKPETLVKTSRAANTSLVDVTKFKDTESQTSHSRASPENNSSTPNPSRNIATGPPSRLFIPPPEIERQLWNIGVPSGENSDAIRSQKRSLLPSSDRPPPKRQREI